MFRGGGCDAAMKVLVTGGAGYIGSHACKALARAGHEPLAFDNLSTGHRWAVRWGELVVADLADGAAVRRALTDHGAEAVMHFAASAYVGASVTDPRAYYANNLTNGLGLLDAMLDTGVRLIVFSSSCATFGVQQTPLLDEQHIQAPVNPYGETKLAFERALRWYDGAYGLRSVALRYFNAAGADPDGEIGEHHDPEPHLVPNVLRAAAREIPCVEIFGDDYPTPDGTAVRDYVHVTDLAAAHVLALDHLAGGGASLQLNLGTGTGHSVREVVTAASAVVGSEIPTRLSPRRAGDPPLLVADGRAARRALGWAPRLSDLESILRTAWSWRARAATEAKD
jgi:UDP-arabinose 4-epimerase